jgi:hypothetical protein
MLLLSWSGIIYCVQVDSTQNISEYDEETQATIRRLMYDQRQKVRHQ